MTATMNSTALFQNYIENNFKIPKEIKHDIVYCQRAMKAHIKVHQMVLDVYKTQQIQNPVEKKRIIDELETQIYEINAEQMILLMRLRSIISDFNKLAERKGAIVIQDLLHDQISNELVPLVNDPNLLIYPTTIQLRCTEEKLIEKYFEVKKNDTPSNYIEILDSDEEELQRNEISISELKKKQQNQRFKPISVLNNSKSKDENTQTSLLKPMSRWTLPSKLSTSPAAQNNQHSSSKSVPSATSIDKPSTSKGIEPSNRPRGYSSQGLPTHNSQFFEVSSDVIKGNKTGISTITPNITVSTIKENTKPACAGVYPVSISAFQKVTEGRRDDSSVSQNIKRSRLNLRQVLKNAQNENLAAKAATNNLPKAAGNQPATTGKVSAQIKKPETEKNNRKSPKSSSGDSTPERCLTPTRVSLQFPKESVNTNFTPEDLGQEMFLRMFGLYTPEMRTQMSQRRSKRQRRTVQSNERSDYHYGTIETGGCASAGDKKKRKTFLLSPQVKRKQGRPSKRRKSDEATTSRSSSSSPDAKRVCNECLKNGGTLQSCKGCKNYFHQSCHFDIEQSSTSKIKICPACRRQLGNETQQHQSLRKSAIKFQQQLTFEKTRQKSLQQKSKTFKARMSTLFNIIKAIKKDSESDSD